MPLHFYRSPRKSILLLIIMVAACFSACSTTPPTDYCTIAPPDPNPHLAQVNGTLLMQASYTSSIYALQASNGTSQWQYSANQLNVLPDAVYANGSNNIYALQPDTGQQIWHTSNVFFIAATSSMVFVESVNPTPLLIALDASTGKQLWQQTIDMNVPPHSIQVANGLVYVASDYGLARALKISDGTQVWQYNTGASPGGENNLVMDISNGVVYLKSDQIYALRASNGSVLWRFPKSGNSMLLNNGIVYAMADHLANGQFVSDTVYALRASDGTQLWQWATPTTDQPYQLSIGNGVLYLGPQEHAVHPIPNSYQNHLYVLNSSTGKPLWDTPVSDKGVSLAATDTTVYLLSSSTLEAHRISDGTTLWHTPINETELLVANSVVYAATAGNSNSCFATTPSTIDAVNMDNGTHLWSRTLKAVTSPTLQ